MKATLEFDLPTEQDDFEVAAKASKYRYALSEIRQKLRSYAKHGHDFTSASEAVERIYQDVCEHIADTGDESL